MNRHPAYGREGLERMLLSLGNDAAIYVSNENKLNSVLPGTWIQSPQLLARIELIEPNVAGKNAEVNTGGIENVQTQEQAGGLRLPGLSSPQTGTPSPVGSEEEHYLMEDQEGFIVRVPADRVESWETAQRERGNAPLTKSEQRLKEEILRRIYG